MKKSIFLLFLTTFLSIIIFSSCTDLLGLSEKNKELIISSYKNISISADSLLLTEDPISGFKVMISTYESYPEVEKAWVDGNTLFVQFEEGGVVMWLVTSDDIVPPYLVKPNRITSVKNAVYDSSSENKPSNNKAVLINQQYSDESRPFCRDIINNLKTDLEKANYECTVKNGEEADINFIEDSFADYGVIFYISHGKYDEINDDEWILSGEECEENTIDQLTTVYYKLWKQHKLSVGSVEETRDGKVVNVNFFMFSEDYISEEYKSKKFPNSLIYLTACQGMKSENLAKAFVSKGAGVVIGWDETNCIGKFTGGSLFNLLIGGYDLETSFDALPAESKHCTCDTSILPRGAYITYYPTDKGGKMRLVDKTETEIIIESPVLNSTSSERVIQVRGYFEGYKNVSQGTLEVNNITSKLNITGNNYAQTFNQTVVIKNGSNTIKVNCYGELSDGTPSSSSKEITVNGNFPVLDLFTELRWDKDNSDVDIHLLPPGYGIADLWTTKDCYYHNKTTSWGGYLDVDNVVGRGPEHITMPKVTMVGKYTLYVHFYQDKGANSTNAFIDVSVKDGLTSSFGPLFLDIPAYLGTNSFSSDLWEVCTIEFPSGIITPVKKLHSFDLRAASSNVLYHMKKNQ